MEFLRCDDFVADGSGGFSLHSPGVGLRAARLQWRENPDSSHMVGATCAIQQ
jgi:hypothetical protein